MLGDKVTLDTFDGPMEVNIPTGIQSGQLIRLAHLGVPYLQKKGRGDLLLKVIVLTPKSISKKQRELLEQLKKEGL
ncbi:J domain-containing protein [Candidatus Uhrbacteria bacterium]|nr:J domain-containing protein [Candidatus Uhrbacteria bacterium]